MAVGPPGKTNIADMGTARATPSSIAGDKRKRADPSNSMGSAQSKEGAEPDIHADVPAAGHAPASKAMRKERCDAGKKGK